MHHQRNSQGSATLMPQKRRLNRHGLNGQPIFSLEAPQQRTRKRLVLRKQEGLRQQKKRQHSHRLRSHRHPEQEKRWPRRRRHMESRLYPPSRNCRLGDQPQFLVPLRHILPALTWPPFFVLYILRRFRVLPQAAPFRKEQKLAAVDRSGICPKGRSYSDCAYRCNQTCNLFLRALVSDRKCLGDDECVPGCRPTSGCEAPRVWLDYDTCIEEEECSCSFEEEVLGVGRHFYSLCLRLPPTVSVATTVHATEIWFQSTYAVRECRFIIRAKALD
nr:uncharacterized protein LOC129387558 [Dermacentor andersoni]